MESEVIEFTKMQGVGNDFIVVDGRVTPPRDWPSLAPRLCDRRFGIGADGILLIESALDADARMRMFNPDGTEDFCGNGLRCVARYVAEGQRTADDRRPTTELVIATSAGPRDASVRADGSVTVEMGVPRFSPEDIPLAQGALLSDTPLPTVQLPIDGERLQLFSLSTGTTHSIIFVDELPEDERFLRLSPKIEHHPAFPERTSIMWAKVEAPGRLKLRIWERGAGETWGCGSGACAAAVAAQLTGRSGEETRVASKGGALRIQWSPPSQIQMSGPAEYVFRGSMPL